MVQRQKNKALYAALGVLVFLTGCASNAPITHQPMSARPVIEKKEKEVASAGSLFTKGSYRSLYDTKKPGRVGDVLTILIAERTQANTQSSTSLSKGSTMDASISGINGLPFKGLNGLSAASESTQTFDGSGNSAINNAFNGSITVTVIDVYDNGNLLVSGEKQLGINQGKEFVRFSGVVNPEWLENGQVSSSRVADARLEYKQDGVLNSAQVMGWLGRFFLSFLP